MAEQAKNPSGGTAAACARLARPEAEALGLLLWDVRFVREGTMWYLRIYIDREDEPVSIDDCVAMSRRMDKALDEADPIPQAYCLEVCSPGVERELVRPEHFARFEGWPVLVRLIRPVEGRREFSGILQSGDGMAVTIVTQEGEEKTFSKKETSAVHLIEDWDEEDYEGDTDNE